MAPDGETARTGSKRGKLTASLVPNCSPPLVTYPHSVSQSVVDASDSLDDVENALNDLEAGVERQTTQVADDLTALEESIEEKSVAVVREQLGELKTAISKIPSPEPPPQTTLQIQNQADVEGAWQNYLQYLLNPDANHGLGMQALVLFLRGLDNAAEEKFPTRVSDDVVVDAEVSSPNGNRPDIVIYEPEEFFVCCELKLYSSEGENQTRNYYEDNYIGTTLKSQFPEQGHHYVYVKRPDPPEADCKEFVNVTWKQVQEWLKPLVHNNQGRYPTRTTAQLTDFLDTIQQDMTQDEYMQTAQEKMKLYFAHEDAIREAEQALDTVYDHEVSNWRRRFIKNYLPENWGPNWHTNSNRYGQIYHTKWRQDGELAVSDADIEMHFVHLIRNKDSFEEGHLTMQLRWPGESRYRDRFKDLFISERFEERLDSRLAKHNIEKRADYSYSNPRFIEKVYPVVKSELPESYYESLQQAAKEHIDVAQVINEILDAAIKEVEADL